MDKNETKQVQIKLLRVPEVAKMLGISRALTYNLIQSKELRSVHIRSARRVRPEDLSEYIRSNLSSKVK